MALTQKKMMDQSDKISDIRPDMTSDMTLDMTRSVTLDMTILTSKLIDDKRNGESN